MFLLNATKSCLSVRARELLVAGSVNVNQVKFEFSDDWSDLVKTVTFRTVSDSRSVILNDEGECVIPWEVLKESSPYLYVGLIGTRDAEVVLPTIWADLGEVRNGTKPGADVTDPTPTVYEQVLSELGRRANNLNVKDEKLQLRSGETVLSEVELPKQEEPGTTDHSALLNRDLPDQHPIEAITGLADALKEAGSGGGGVQADWNVNDESDPAYVKNRTHWVETFEPVEWNGNTEGRESIDGSALGLGNLYKISDNAWPMEAVLGGLWLSSNLDAGSDEDAYYQKPTVLVSDESIGIAVETRYAGYTQVVLSAFIAADLTDVIGLVIPSPGVYLFDTAVGGSFGITILRIKPADISHPIDKKFLPNDVVMKDYLDAPLAFDGQDIPVDLSGREVQVHFNAYASDEFVAELTARPEVRVRIYANYGTRDVLFHFEPLAKHRDGIFVATAVVVFEDGENARAYAVCLSANIYETYITTWAKELSDDRITLHSPNGTPFKITVSDDGGLKVGGTGQDDENAQSVVLSVNGQKPDSKGNVNVAGGSGSDGRCLKVIEAATIEELYNKVVALDNPVIFTITSDGCIEYDFDNGSGYIDFSGYVKCRVLDSGGGYGLIIEEFSPNALGSAAIVFDGEIVEGEWFNIMENAYYELTTIDMSGITKFTLYYF